MRYGRLLLLLAALLFAGAVTPSLRAHDAPWPIPPDNPPLLAHDAPMPMPPIQPARTAQDAPMPMPPCNPCGSLTARP